MCGITPTINHIKYMDDLKALIAKHGAGLTGPELLALSAQMVGNIIALQDQKTMTSDQAIMIVSKNMEIGNKVVLDQMANHIGTA